MSKKILSMLLAVVMLFSVLGVSAFAATSADWIGMVVKTDAVIGQGAGTTVRVNIYYQFPDGFDASDYRHGLSDIALVWNSAKYSYSSYTYNMVNPDGDSFLLLDTPSPMPTKRFNNMAKNFSSYGEAGYGWNTATVLSQDYDLVGQDLDSGNAYTVNTGYEVPVDGTGLVSVATVTFNVLGTLTADDVIGVSGASVAAGRTRIDYFDGAIGQTYENVKTENAKPAVKEVANKAVQIQKTGTGVYSLGFVGTFCMDPAFAANGKSSAIKSLGAEVWVDGIKVDGEHETNYAYVDSDNGGYKFRTVLTNVAATGATKVITVKLYAVLADGTKVEAYETSTTLADQIARATAAGNGFVA